MGDKGDGEKRKMSGERGIFKGNKEMGEEEEGYMNELRE